jgi:hypothetical protein
MQYIISEEEMAKIRGQSKDIVANMRKALLDHMHHSVPVRTRENAEGNPYVNDVQADSAQGLANLASKGHLGHISSEEFNRIRARLWCKWEPLLKAIEFICKQAEESLK